MFLGVTCEDEGPQSDYSALFSTYTPIAQSSPRFAWKFWDATPQTHGTSGVGDCVGWPFPATNAPHVLRVGPHPNVLVANDAHDPAAPHAESIFAVTLPDFTLKSDECVIAFRCSVRGARIVRLSSVPDDWTVAIDNENTSTLKAHIVDGVAALRPGQTEGQTNYFRNFLVIEKEASGEFALPFYVKVDVTVATNAELTALRHVRFVGDQIILRAAE